MALPKQPHAPAAKYEPELMFMQLTWGIIMLDIYTTHSLLLAQCTMVAPCLWTGQSPFQIRNFFNGKRPANELRADSKHDPMSTK